MSLIFSLTKLRILLLHKDWINRKVNMYDMSMRLVWTHEIYRVVHRVHSFCFIHTVDFVFPTKKKPHGESTRSLSLSLQQPPTTLWHWTWTFPMKNWLLFHSWRELISPRFISHTFVSSVSRNYTLYILRIILCWPLPLTTITNTKEEQELLYYYTYVCTMCDTMYH